MADNKPADKDKVGLVKYLGQVRQEGRKVVWPTRQETTTTTILVMIMVILMGAFFFVVDWFARTGVGLAFSFLGSLLGGGA